MNRAEQIALMFYKSRTDGKKSQEYMALEMEVAKKTVQNWEKGVSSPTMLQFAEWFKILHLNPMPYILEMLYPNLYDNFNGDDTEVELAFDSLCKQIPISEKRAWLFIYGGKHGSSPHSLIQLLLAHLHCPLTSRVMQAEFISSAYKMNKDLDLTNCNEEILPDTVNLDKAVEYGRLAVMNREYGYELIDK